MIRFHSHNSADVLRLSQKKVGSDFDLSRNFKLSEFSSKDGADIVFIHPALILALQAIRDHFEKPVTINSGYRSAAHNKKIGGAPASLHLRGMAADIVIDGYSPSEVAYFAKNKLGLGGVKAYPTFTHIDVGAPRTW